MIKTTFETISTTHLETTTGGLSARWLANHPYAAAGFLDHHPIIEQRFAANHPWAYARIQRLAG